MHSVTIIALLAVFLQLTPPGSAARERPEKTLGFEGYAITDSLDYSAESIRYLYAERKIILTGNAVITYLGRTLKSHTITYYQDLAFMVAEGIEDSTGALVNTPVFTDVSGDELHGVRISYNTATQEGFVEKGRTQYESGFMSARSIKRASEDTLFVANGTYTTCDLEENPHYYFAGKRMKFIINDKLIIKPIVGYISDIPVFWFPFYVFPIKKGRQSGFLTPRYGSSRRDGRYISNAGYYFAPSDYLDYKVGGTLRERNGWLVNNWVNYNKKYSMSGSIFGSYEHRTSRDDKSKQWKLRASHRQTVTPTLTIDGSGRFESSSYSSYNSYNIYERMNRDMRSTLTVRKQWKESGNSLITTMSYNKNLDNKTTDTMLPSISFRKQRKLLFGDDPKKKGARKYRTDTSPTGPAPWYNTIYYSFNARMNNRLRGAGDETDEVRDMNLSTSLSSSQKLMGWLVTQPSLNLRENFVFDSARKSTERYERKDNLSMGVSMGTTIYGMFQPKIGGLTALRHVLSPSVSYSYGKRRSYAGDEADILYRLDRNDEDKGRVQSMNINIRNIFQAKTVKGDKENKFDLFTLNFSSSVNFEAEKRKVAPLRTTLDLKPFKNLTTRLTASHDFYHEDDSFDIMNPSLDNLSITTSAGLSRSSLGFIGTSARDNANASMGRDDFDMGENMGMPGVERGTGRGGNPFRVRLSHTYGIRRSTRPGPDNYVVTHTIKPTISFSPSGNLSVNYYFYYNLEEKNMVSQRIIINRDLHCWEANISWVPAGYQEGFYFKVNIKELPDIKVEKRRGRSRISY